ncbi:hypothetical protein RGQ29_027978 [Quercus rubra]|uniref:Uncharacterized protein n=1 Tax=Quercus rubra TaxID=3512 RepID=A0AAN7ESG0_QUERU|nr:hypothetical protein RGQ29_027978 [Quercus rubra]KAK4577680.1 hypothetical protein RGQ29_027978 [Quercus rubra]
MDVKSLAKSKRAHTQSHSKRPHGSHANQKSKAPSVGTNDAGRAKKPLGKQVPEKPHRSQGASRLPTNWDRYEEEFDSGSEDPSVSNSTSQPSDVILPKSKGADYCHLIAEAQSQSQSNLYMDSFPSLDDVMPGEFNQGLGPMLSVRGEGILSWIGNDNFVVEDKTAATHEASFLSLNLHALAEQLAKIDLSQRLFIEANLLPPELCTEGIETSRCQESNQMQTCYSQASTTISEKFSQKLKIEDQSSEVTSSGSSGSSTNQTLSSHESISVKYIDVDLRGIGKSTQNEASQSTAELSVKSVLDPQKKLSAFEAADAEEELDMLLDSFGETKKAFNPSDFRSNNPFPVSQKEVYVDPSLSKIGPDSSKTSSGIANLDGALDDLLEETSNVMNQTGLLQSLEEKAIHPVQASSSHSGTKSKVLDEFDSWLDTI